MTKELAKFLVKATEHCGSQEISIRETYSGRCMYGRETFAVVVDNQMELMMNVIQYIKEHGQNQRADSFEALEFITDVSDMGRLSIDNMGRDSVVIY
jgi:hypothetical protein